MNFPFFLEFNTSASSTYNMSDSRCSWEKKGKIKKHALKKRNASNFTKVKQQTFVNYQKTIKKVSNQYCIELHQRSSIAVHQPSSKAFFYSFFCEDAFASIRHLVESEQVQPLEILSRGIVYGLLKYLKIEGEIICNDRLRFFQVPL